jgi:hypothetical protein
MPAAILSPCSPVLPAAILTACYTVLPAPSSLFFDSSACYHPNYPCFSLDVYAAILTVCYIVQFCMPMSPLSFPSVLAAILLGKIQRKERKNWDRDSTMKEVPQYCPALTVCKKTTIWLIGELPPRKYEKGGMRHTSTALYFYGASKKSLHKPRTTSGNILFHITYAFNYYLQLLCLEFLSKTHQNC